MFFENCSVDVFWKRVENWIVNLIETPTLGSVILEVPFILTSKISQGFFDQIQKKILGVRKFKLRKKIQIATYNVFVPIDIFYQYYSTFKIWNSTEAFKQKMLHNWNTYKFLYFAFNDQPEIQILNRLQSIWTYCGRIYYFLFGFLGWRWSCSSLMFR